MYKKPTLLILILFLLAPFVLSAQPITQVGDVGLTVENPLVSFLMQNRDVTSHIHVYNSSDGFPMDNTTTSCFLHIYNVTGSEIFSMYYPYSISEGEWEMTIGGGNFSLLEEYGFLIQCNTTEVGGFVRGRVEVTASGTDESTVPIALIYLGILGLLIIFFGLSIYGIVKSDHIIGKYIFVVLTYISFTALAFISFLIATTFILSSPFIVWLLRFLFLFALWIFLPFFFISLGFLLWNLYKMKTIRNLVEKGVPEDEAYKRAKK